MASPSMLAPCPVGSLNHKQRFAGIPFRFNHFVKCSSGFSGGHDPLPLTRSLPVAWPFPVESLGPTMSSAACAFQAKTQAPMDICGNAVLAVAGLAAQAHADVELPTGEVKPLS